MRHLSAPFTALSPLFTKLALEFTKEQMIEINKIITSYASYYENVACYYLYVVPASFENAIDCTGDYTRNPNDMEWLDVDTKEQCFIEMLKCTIAAVDTSEFAL